MYSITALARLTGIKQETIRTWERRYRIVTPGRDSRGRRVYKAEDLQFLRGVAELVRSGHSVRDIVDWDREQFDRSLNECRTLLPDRALTIREELFDLIKRADFQQFEQVIGYSLTSLGAVSATEGVISPVLQRIGELWRSGELDIDEEHQLSVIVKRQLFLAMACHAPSSYGPTILFTTISEEQHELGALMACFVAASARCDCRYLGPNLPTEYVAKAAARTGAAAVALGVVLARDVARVEAELQALVRAAPKDVAIVVGLGQPARFSRLKLPKRIVVVDNLHSFNLWVGHLP